MLYLQSVLYFFMRSVLLLGFASFLFNACTKDDLPTPQTPIHFYGSGFDGYYEADTIFSNGANVTIIVKMTISLSASTLSGAIQYKETNPLTGTTFTNDLNIDFWNMNPNQDTLFIDVLTGTHQEQREYSSGDGASYYETVTVNDYAYYSMPFKRVAPSRYVLERDFNGIPQKFHLIKW